MKRGEDYIGISIAYLCHDGKGNYLFNKRSVNCRDEHGAWDNGGGGLEYGDGVTDTLKKEIREEYCTDVLDHEFLGFREAHRENAGKRTHWISLDFKVLVDRSQVKNGEPHKFDEIGWFHMDALPQPLHSMFPAILKQYRNKL